LCDVYLDPAPAAAVTSAAAEAKVYSREAGELVYILCKRKIYGHKKEEKGYVG
jgi:hypothetical protein